MVLIFLSFIFFLPFSLQTSGNLAALIFFEGLCSQGHGHTAVVAAQGQPPLKEKVIQVLR